MSRNSQLLKNVPKEYEFPCCYFIADKRIGKIIYIGKTKHFGTRAWEHRHGFKQAIDKHINNQDVMPCNFIIAPFQIDSENNLVTDFNTWTGNVVDNTFKNEGILIEMYDTRRFGFNIKKQNGKYVQYNHNKECERFFENYKRAIECDIKDLTIYRRNMMDWHEN